MERRSSPGNTRRAKKKQKIGAKAQNDSAGCLGFVLELGADFVLDYLAAEDMLNCFQVCAGGLSEEFVETMSLKTLDQFAVENATHIGHKCPCDWMRSLDFVSHRGYCSGDALYGVDKSMPILQNAGGALKLVSALALAKRILLPFCIDNRLGKDMFVPVVCVFAEESVRVDSKEALTTAMNRITKGFGKQFFCDSVYERPYKKADFIDEHWDSIQGSACVHCDNMSGLPRQNIMRRAKWKPGSVKRIRANCAEVYRPLKAAMEKELRFVRFIRRPQHGPKGAARYQGLVAGISPSGVLCGLYLENGFWSYKINRQTRR